MKCRFLLNINIPRFSNSDNNHGGDSVNKIVVRNKNMKYSFREDVTCHQQFESERGFGHEASLNASENTQRY